MSLPDPNRESESGSVCVRETASEREKARERERASERERERERESERASVCV